MSKWKKVSDNKDYFLKQKEGSSEFIYGKRKRLHSHIWQNGDKHAFKITDEKRELDFPKAVFPSNKELEKIFLDVVSSKKPVDPLSLDKIVPIGPNDFSDPCLSQMQVNIEFQKEAIKAMLGEEKPIMPNDFLAGRYRLGKPINDNSSFVATVFYCDKCKIQTMEDSCPSCGERTENPNLFLISIKELIEMLPNIKNVQEQSKKIAKKIKRI